MAMLAETRRRKKYNLCPRGKALYEDETRFGTKMLEKMGWSKGQGLGANLEGSQDFVRIRFKNDAEGLGYEQRNDQWTSHEEGFNGLLKALNGGEKAGDEIDKNGNASASEEETRPMMGFGFKPETVEEHKTLKEKISGVSLEEKSKTSKARVHYKKFTRGKDLAQYSEKDLANIFGKKATDVIEIPAGINQVEEPVEEEKRLNPNFAGVQTVSTGLSVNDYFKLKMEAIKNKLKNNNTAESKPLLNEDVETEAVSAAGEKESKKKKHKEQEEQLTVAAPEQKKHKKSKRAAEENAEQIDAESEETTPPKPKKKKKNKQDDAEELVAAELMGESEHKKKKKSKNVEETACLPVETETDEPVKKKSKKNKKENQEELIIEPELIEEKTEQIEKLTKKKSKKRKRENEAEQLNEEKSLSKIEETIEETVKSSKKKNKKDKNKSEENLIIQPSTEEEEHKTAEDPVKKKSKKNKKEDKAEEPNQDKCDKAEKKKNKKKKKDDKEELILVSEEDDQTTVPKIKRKSKKTVDDEQTEKEIIDVSTEDTSSSEEQTEQPVETTEEILKKLDSFNIFKISTFCSEKFQLVNMNKFKGSSLPQITGYGIDENINLKIVEGKGDDMRILDLWNCKINKYGIRTPVSVLKANYHKFVPKSTIRAVKRRQAFTGW